MSYEETLKNIAIGAATGLVYAALGYWRENGNEFDEYKFAQSIVVGAFVGGFAGYAGMEFTEAKEYLTLIGAVGLVEYVKKIIWNRLVGAKIKKLLGRK